MIPSTILMYKINCSIIPTYYIDLKPSLLKPNTIFEIYDLSQKGNWLTPRGHFDKNDVNNTFF